MDLWFDTDPGFDDWMAWALLEAEPTFRCMASAWWRATRRCP
jgi:inosine-uridine nucleoside N-ribohydrolase